MLEILKNLSKRDVSAFCKASWACLQRGVVSLHTDIHVSLREAELLFCSRVSLHDQPGPTVRSLSDADAQLGHWRQPTNNNRVGNLLRLGRLRELRLESVHEPSAAQSEHGLAFSADRLDRVGSIEVKQLVLCCGSTR